MAGDFKMKKINFRKNKKAAAIVLTLLFLAACSITLFFMFRTRGANKFTVLFYRIPDSMQGHISGILAKEKNDRGEPIEFNFVNAENEAQLALGLKKADLVFTLMGKEADNIVASIPEKNFSSSLFDSKTIGSASISAATVALESPFSGNKKVSQIPILFDGYEMLLSKPTMEYTNTNRIASWLDIENFAEKAKDSCPAPIVFAGGDDDILLGVLSVIIEALEGKETHHNLIKTILTAGGDMKELVKKLSQEDQPLEEVMKRFARWKKNKIFTTDILNMNCEEVRLLLERHTSAVSILPLSEHRKIAPGAVKYLTTIPIHTSEMDFYFPSMRALNTRAVISPMVCMISRTPNSTLKNAAKALVQEENQEFLARSSGLAPLLANCKIPDMQSDDIRFWIAASSKPEIPLGLAAFDNEKKKHQFAQAIRQYISNLQ